METPEVVNPQNCSGCGTCELAGSFHNGPERSFQPSVSHIRAVRAGGLNRFHPEFSEECNGLRRQLIQQTRLYRQHQRHFIS